MQRACPHLAHAEAAAYAAPFPDATYKAGVRRFPNLVPDSPDADGAALSRRARDWLRNEWRGPTFMAVGATDPVLGPPVMDELRAVIRGCPEPYVHPQAGHFVQEWGEEVAGARACSRLGASTAGTLWRYHSPAPRHTKGDPNAHPLRYSPPRRSPPRPRTP